MKLDSKKHYLQVALNSNIYDAQRIIASLPQSDRIIIEVGTPLIKEFGAHAIRSICSMWQSKLLGFAPSFNMGFNNSMLASSIFSFAGRAGQPAMQASTNPLTRNSQPATPYIVADLKCMDRAQREVQIAYQGGASAAIVLGQAPIETVNEFIASCNELGIDSMVDMMNIDQPYKVLRKLKKLPDVVLLHRGVDETELGDKPLPIHLINKVKGAYDVAISIAGGDTSREVQSAFFNGANIVVLWKNFYSATQDTAQIANEFLQQVK